jgi:hypothetical protein
MCRDRMERLLEDSKLLIAYASTFAPNR